VAATVATGRTTSIEAADSGDQSHKTVVAEADKEEVKEEEDEDACSLFNFLFRDDDDDDDSAAASAAVKVSWVRQVCRALLWAWAKACLSKVGKATGPLNPENYPAATTSASATAELVLSLLAPSSSSSAEEETKAAVTALA